MEAYQDLYSSYILWIKTPIGMGSDLEDENHNDVHEKKKPKKEANYSQVVEEINKTSTGRCVVYCATPKICEDLKIYVTNEITNCEIDLYHATNAFGMGINTSDVYLIIHFNFLLSLGQYIQESGRAGRDGSQSKRIGLGNRRQDTGIKIELYLICDGESSVNL
ncbi:4212_t:CDS:2 [Entrophospora sp. SA101]|nr:4212_t:CDS:2 [Entrophospora sp. SA101]